MATGEQSSIDELISCVVGMGFEIEDAQLAVKNGKLSIEDAVDWILAGKPVVRQDTAPRLRLNQPSGPATDETIIGSNPFRNPQPVAAPPPSSSSSESPKKDGESSTSEPQDQGVVSRLAMNEQQRKIKDQFFEKQRTEAQKEAKQNRIAKKKAHDFVLQEIAKDREMQKVKAQKKNEESATSSGASASPAPQSTPPKAPLPAVCRCLLQVRLPDGRSVRRNFTPQTAFSEVWVFVREQFPDCDNMMLMQPFPRQEYGAEHMQKSFEELGLVPSGSLVLKKIEGAVLQQPADAEAPMEVDKKSSDESNDVHMESNEEDVPNVVVPGLQPGQLPFAIPGAGPLGGPLNNAGQPQPSHSWGQGHKLGQNNNQGGAEAEMEVLEVDDHAVPQNNANEEADEEMDDHSWGLGQALAGAVFAPQNMPHHVQAARSLAGDAAAKRFVNQPAEGPSSPSSPSTSGSAAVHQVSTLAQLLIQHIGSRLVNNRPPVTTLQSLPVEIAMKLINYLIQERLLKPKTLAAFISCHLRNLNLDCYPYSTNELLMALRLHAFIAHLSLGSCPFITDQGLQPLKALKRMKHLSLRGNRQLTNATMSVIAEFQNLVTLVLEDTSVNDEGILIYSKSKPQNLQHLVLNRTPITHACLEVLGTENFPQLKSLGLEGTQVSDLRSIQNLTQLETLDLCRTPVKTESLRFLSSLTSLKALNIANTPNLHGDLALEQLTNMPLLVLQMPSRHTTSNTGLSFIQGMSLTTLDLTNYVLVTDDGTSHIGKIQTLKKLRLSNTGITDTGMQGLEQLHNLEELYLDRTSVGDNGLAAIRNFPGLTELSLSETKVTNQFLRAGALENCQSLTKLNLSKTSVSNKGVKSVRLTNLSVINLNATRVRVSIDGVLRLNCPSLRTVLLAGIIPATESEEEDL